ncbi:hypothetical protein PFAS1_23355 [Pseudomonas frederiksbergensis]|nr:hypothetical protein PFAS1_23355 [Pseudomonas frederiksbergensis]
MKRNIQTARSVLYAVQTYSKPDGIEKFHLESLHSNNGCSQEDWDYAVRLLADSRYLVFDTGYFRMTWAGHDLLDSLS